LFNFGGDNVKDAMFLHGVSVNYLSGDVGSFVNTNSVNIRKYIDKLLSSNRKKDEFIIKVLKNVGSEYIYNLCLYHFVYILSQSGTDNDKNVSVAAVTVKSGKYVMGKYLSNEKGQQNNIVRYNEWIVEYCKNNPDYADAIKDGDSFYSKLGAKICDILTYNEFLDIEIVKVSKNQSYNIFNVANKNLVNNAIKNSLVIPMKLPMVVPPKDYTKTEYGGYILNNVEYCSGIFTKKKFLQN
jgi:hypothetical protein